MSNVIYELDLYYAHIVQICAAVFQVIPIYLIWSQHQLHSQRYPHGAGIGQQLEVSRKKILMQRFGLWGVTLYEILLCLQIIDPWCTEGTLRGIYMLGFLATVIEAKLVTTMVLGTLYSEYASLWSCEIARSRKISITTAGGKPNFSRYYTRGLFYISAIGTVASCYLGWSLNTEYLLLSASAWVFFFFTFVLLLINYCRICNVYSETQAALPTITIESLKSGRKELIWILLFFLSQVLIHSISLYDSYLNFGTRFVSSKDEGENLLFDSFKATSCSSIKIVTNIGGNDSLIILAMLYTFWLPAKEAGQGSTIQEGVIRGTQRPDTAGQPKYLQGKMEIPKPESSETRIKIVKWAETEEKRELKAGSVKADIEMVKRLETEEALKSSADSEKAKIEITKPPGIKEAPQPNFSSGLKQISAKFTQSILPVKKTTKFSPRRDAQELQSQNAKQAGYPSRLGYFIQDPEKPSSPSLKPSTSNDGDDHSLEDMSSFAEDNASLFRIVQ